MLHFSRTKATAILLAALVICAFNALNFLPDEMVKSWPAWAQRRLVLGPDLQGGSTFQLEVDRNDLRGQILKSLHRDVRSALHEAHIDLVRPVALRADGVEVRPLELGFQAALAKLSELSEPFGAARPADVIDVGGGLIRVIPTDAAIAEYEQRTIDQSIQTIKARMLWVDATIRREGSRGITIEIPGVGDPQRLGTVPGMVEF
jgi:preprotein translocase subunit SecD